MNYFRLIFFYINEAHNAAIFQYLFDIISQHLRPILLVIKNENNNNKNALIQ